MLTDVVRFNRLARALLPTSTPPTGRWPICWPTGTGRPEFVDWYLVPMGSSIWSADPGTFLDMPAVTFARFFDNHGLLDYGDQPSWRTVDGGSSRYVEAICRPARRRSRACRSPVAKVTRRRRRGASSTRTRARSGSTTWSWPPTATRPCDCCPTPPGSSATSSVPSGTSPTGPPSTPTSGCCPRNRRAWASWNYHRLADQPERATLTYRSASACRASTLPTRSWSRSTATTPSARTGSWPASTTPTRCSMPRPSPPSAATRSSTAPRRTWFCGAYWGYGFHEDGVQSALTVCRRLAGEDL